MTMQSLCYTESSIMFMILYSVGNLMMMMMFEDIIHRENVC